MRPAQTLLLAAALLAAAWAHGATQVPANVQVLTVDMEPGYADRATISGDGRFVAFPFRAVANPTREIYMQDRLTGERRLVSRGADGSPGNADSDDVMLTRVGHYLFFMSRAPNLGVPASGYGLFRYDWDHDKLETLLVTATQGFTYLGYNESFPPSPSADGSQVFFLATNAGTTAIYQLDVGTRAATAVIPQPANWALTPARHMASADGRFLAYLRTPQVADGQTRTEAYVYDRTSATQRLINVSYTGDLATAVSPNTAAKDLNVSDDGQVAAFSSQSTTLLYPAKSSPTFDAYVRDLTAGVTSQLSATSTSTNTQFPALSGDGRIAAFAGIGKNSSQGGLWTWDRRSGVEKLIIAGNGTAWPDLNSDGRYLVFFLYAVPGSAHNYDLAVADLGPPPGLSVTPTTLAATEGGMAATYSIALSTAPSADVTVTIGQSAQYTTSATTLTFTSANWNTPQIVSVSAVLDGKTEGNQAITIANTASSSDLDYQGLTPANVTLNITDTVVPTFAVATSGGVWNLDPLLLTGTAAPNATVVLTIHNSVTGDLIAVSATADANGNWSSSVSGLADGSYDLQADAGGIKSATLSIKVDSHAPVSTLALSSAATRTADGWYNAPVTATLAATDGAGGLGIQRSEYTLDNGAWTVFPSAGLNIASDASHTLCYRSVDKAGNVEATRCTAVAIDQAAPVVAAAFVQATNTLTLAVTDTGAGIKLAETSSDNGVTWTAYAAPLVFTKDGNVTVLYRATDKAGNVKSGQLTFNVATPPAVTAPPAQATQEATAATISLGSFSDADPTGSWSVDVDWGDGSPHLGTSKTAVGPLGSASHTYADNGSYAVKVTVTDQNGSSTSASFTVNVANVAPTAVLAAPATAVLGTPVTVSLTGGADVSPKDQQAGLRYAFACDGASLAATTYATAAANNAASCTFASGGAQTVRARVIDKDNGYTEYTGTVTVAYPVTIAVAGNGSWTQPDLLVTGTAGPGANVSVTLTRAGVATNYSATANAQGNWTLTLPSLADGSYEVQAQADGQQSARLAVTVDWHAPVSTLVLSSNGTLSAANWYNAAVLANVTAADPAGGTGVQRSEYTLDGAAAKAFTGAGLTIDAQGTHALCYRSVDVAGNAEAYRCVNIAVDTTAPAVSAAFNQVLNALTLTATDAGSGIDTVDYSVDGGATWKAYAGVLAFNHDGPLTVQYRAADKAGNRSAGQISFTVVTVPVVAAAPNQQMTEAAPGAVTLGSFTDADPTGSWTVDVDWGDGSAHASFPRSATGSLGTLNHTYGDSGTYTVTVKVTDQGGSVDSSSFTVNVANVAPTASFSAPATAFVGGSAMLSLSNAADVSAADTNAGLRFVFACDGAALGGTTYQNAGTATSTACQYTAPGTQTVRARVYDKDNGYTEYTAAINVLVPVTLDPIPGPWTQSALPVSGTAAANAAVQVVFTNTQANTATTVNATADPQGKWSATANGLPDGSYQVVAQSGGFGTSPVALTIDWHAPVSTVALAAANPASAAGWYNGAVTATVSAADPAGGTGVARTEYALDGGTYATMPTSGVQVAADGQHSFCYRAADNAGNVETARCTAIAIDTAAPQVSASFDSSVNNLTVSASDTGAGVQAVQYSTDNGATWTAYTGAVHFAHDGNVTVQYRALDKAGNSATGQLAFNVATPPAVTAPAAQAANEGASTKFALGSFTDADPTGTWSVDVDWGDGSAHGAAGASATGSLGSLAHTYADNGNYTATVSVTDANGSTGSRSFPVTVANVAPTAQLNVPATSIAGTYVPVALQNGADASAADGAALRYAFACDGGSLSGATYATASASNTTNCVYVAAGVQAIRARVFDKDGGYTEYTGSTTVSVVARDVTAGTGTASSPLTFELKGHTYSGTVTITNNTALPYPGPIYVIFEGLNTNRVRMDNASGTYNGNYYVMLQVGSLAPGAAQTFPVTFWNPSADDMNYTLKVYSGKLP
ncbi:MAG: OmpL47-type beta-barrel domain-containing protein [Telluria sp.]